MISIETPQITLSSKEDWQKWKLAHAFNLIGSGTTPPTGSVEYFQGKIPWVNTGDLNDGYVYSVKKFVSEKAIVEFSALKIFPQNSLIIAMYGATIGKLGILRMDACTNQACCILAKPNYLDIKFVFYSLISDRNNIIELAQGGGQPNISQEVVKNLRVFAPNIATQKLIACFLDRKIAAIDTLIANKQRLIQLLEEKRTALINQAVTKGLNPNAPMKDSDISAIVAFTAFTDRETGISYTESDLNGFGERELPEKFETVEYQMLIVADKYQTGFDQPLLHTMYVDKKLAGVKAVQTLSRLNRICPGKEETFILDFANEEQEIIDAFQPYYEQTILAATTNPNRLYDLKSRIDSFQLIWTSEVDGFARVFFKPTERTSRQDHARLNALVDPACDRFTGLEEEQQDEFKNTLGTFIRLYAFLAQIMPFADEELEKFYAFARLLQTKLPKQLQSEIFKLMDEVGLEYYRLQKVREGQIVLQKDSELSLQPSTEAGMPKDKESQAKLSEIIYLLNKRFNTDFTDADKYFFSQIEEELIRNESLSQQVKSNSIQNLKYSFSDLFNATLIERMEENQDISIKIFDDREFGDAIRDWMLKKVYDRITEELQSS